MTHGHKQIKHAEIDDTTKCHELIGKLLSYRQNDCFDMKVAHKYIHDAEILCESKNIDNPVRDNLYWAKIQLLNTIHFKIFGNYNKLKTEVKEAIQALINSRNENDQLNTFTKLQENAMLFCENNKLDEQMKMELKNSCLKLKSLIENYPSFSNLMREIEWLDNSPRLYSDLQYLEIFGHFDQIIQLPEMDPEYKLNLRQAFAKLCENPLLQQKPENRRKSYLAAIKTPLHSQYMPAVFYT